MLAFQAGNVSAFRTLFHQYKKKIVNYCFRFCNDRYVAEELAQEVFLRVHKAAPRYRPDAAFSTWIFKIATNVCLNELRKKKYDYETESMDAPKHLKNGTVPSDFADEDQFTADGLLEKTEKEKRIRRAIFELPKNQRAAILLCIYEGFTYQEIAVQLGRSESSVKSLIHRARQNLKSHLQDLL